VEPCYPSPCPCDISYSLDQALHKHGVNCSMSNIHHSLQIFWINRSLRFYLPYFTLHWQFQSLRLQNALLKEPNILPSPLSAIINSISSCTYTVWVSTQWCYSCFSLPQLLFYRVREFSRFRRQDVFTLCKLLNLTFMTGNATHPNQFSINLLSNLAKRTGVMPMIRVGGSTQLVSRF
jgi:hypothetical protein